MERHDRSTIDKTDEVIYIDFAYGIPEHLNIEKIIVKNRKLEESDNNEKDSEENKDLNKMKKIVIIKI